MAKINNASQMPKVYFGLHMAEGVAEYREPDSTYRVFLNEATIKSMDPTFMGKPVYVKHVDDVDLENIHEADGYVVRSFYNAIDGKHWCEFLVVSDLGHEKIKAGWKLSNAYHPQGDGKPGGQWHGVDYQKEITSGIYEHLAIVPNPRYSESIILTPEQFKKYNEDKTQDLKKIANSNNEGVSTMKFFKKTKVENSVELENTMVTLPKSGKEKSITQLINEADEMAMKPIETSVGADSEVSVGDEKMKLSELVEKFQALCAELAALKEAGPAKVEPVLENEEDKKKKESEAEEAKKKENDKKAADEAEAAKKKENFLKLANANKAVPQKEAVVEIAQDQVARGKQRYGSK